MKPTKATKSKKKPAKPWITVRVDHIEIEDDDFHLHGERLVVRFRDADGPMRLGEFVPHLKDLQIGERVEDRLNENQSKRDGSQPPAPRPKEDADVQG